MREKEAEKLKKLYKSVEHEKNLTYVKLGKLLDCDKSQVSHMFNGRNPINLERGLQLCRVIGCELSDFSPRLAAEAEAISALVTRTDGVTGSVWLLADLDMKEVVKILKKKAGATQTIFWPGKHSAETYALRVVGTANDPGLPNNAQAVVDTQASYEVGDTVCFYKGNAVAFAIYQGNGLYAFANLDYPDRIFKVRDDKIVGKVIGRQILM